MSDKLQGSCHRNPIWYGDWRIYLNPEPEVAWQHAYIFVHDDYQPDTLDDRVGYVSSIDGAKAAVDAYRLREMAESRGDS